LEGRVDYAVGRTIKFYNDLKVVYQIQTMLHEWQQQSEDQPATVQKSSEPKTDERKLPVRTAPDQTVPAKK